MNSFEKVVILIFALLLLMMIFFTIYNRNTVQVIESEIESANLNKLIFLKTQMEEKIRQVAINAITLANDPAMQELHYLKMAGDEYDYLKHRRSILQHISLQSGITGWMTEITVFSRESGDVISTSGQVLQFPEQEWTEGIQKGWVYQREEGEEHGSFVWYAVMPVKAYDNPSEAEIIVRTSFGAALLQNMLDQYKQDGQGDPLVFHPDYGWIGNRTIHAGRAEELAGYLNSIPLGAEQTNLSVRIAGQDFLISYAPIEGIQWVLIDLIPVETILSPVTKARNLFYIFSLVLLSFGVFASYILYKQLQVPIRQLMRQMQGIKRGNYAARIQMQGMGEFDFLFKKFNEMAEEIQRLLETVYEERIRSKEAVLKQLQSQINPHFLYNCLFFIKNAARLGNEEAVVAMSLNLGEYFRYTTRLGKPTAKLQEEMDVLSRYLEIQKLRMHRIQYSIEVEKGLEEMEIPRLIVQPVVENAVIHGIEPKEGPGTVSIRAVKDDGGFSILIEDDGLGMDEGQIRQLQRKIEYPENLDNVSYGLWNVHQRMKIMFGEASGLVISRGIRAGTLVVMKFRTKGDSDVSNTDRG